MQWQKHQFPFSLLLTDIMKILNLNEGFFPIKLDFEESELNIPNIGYLTSSLKVNLEISKISAGNLSKRPSFATIPRLTGSCEKKTSAGLIAPSSTRVPANSALFAYLTITIPFTMGTVFICLTIFTLTRIR